MPIIITILLGKMVEMLTVWFLPQATREIIVFNLTIIYQGIEGADQGLHPSPLSPHWHLPRHSFIGSCTALEA